MLDLEATARQMAVLLAGADDRLTAPTPCPTYSLGDLIDHVDRLSATFTAAASKDIGPRTSELAVGDATRLPEGWRTRIPAQLVELAEAWREPTAWTGMTQAGSIDLPAEMAGASILNELVIHGWDIGRATGQPVEFEPEALKACLGFVSMFSDDDRDDDGTSPFGRVVEVPADAPLLDQLIGLSGRDPDWTPPSES
jgi:uncharacterized protein (TIGR03086 family)